MGLKSVCWAARLEVLGKNPLVLVDGAHNRAGVAVLCDYLASQKRKYHVVFGTLSDRPFEEMVFPLIPHAQSFYWASFAGGRSFSLEELKQKGLNLFQQRGIDGKVLSIDERSWNDFMTHLSPHEAVLVTGSLYLVSQVRAFYKEKQNGSNPLNN